jgi:biofilm PGA synthesis lipoprotein PgaB
LAAAAGDRKIGAEIGNHSVSHPHLIRKRKLESNARWRARVEVEINKAQAVLLAQLEHPVMAHAYPYGEHNKELRELIAELGFFGLGQNSGPVSHASDFQALSRFPMATGYDLIEDFALKISTRELPVTVLAPVDGVLTPQVAIPELQLRLKNGNYKKSSLNCFASGQQGRIKVEWGDKNTNEITVFANAVLNSGRTKYTCTAPYYHRNRYILLVQLFMDEAHAGWKLVSRVKASVNLTSIKGDRGMP